MATAPQFTTTPRIGAGSVSTANTARDGTGTIATIFTAGSSGSRIEEIVVKASADPADSTVPIFLYDGANYYVFDEFDLDNPAAASATVVSVRDRRRYENLVLPAGWSIRASITAAPTSGVVYVIVLGGDF